MGSIVKKLASFGLAAVMTVSAGVVSAYAQDAALPEPTPAAAGESVGVIQPATEDDALYAVSATQPTTAPATQPAEPQNLIYFDAKSAGWSDYRSVFCTIGDYQAQPLGMLNAVSLEMTDENGDGIYTLQIDVGKYPSDGKKLYSISFSNEKNESTYPTQFSASCVNHTAYVTPKKVFDNPNLIGKKEKACYWKGLDSKQYGPLYAVSILGQPIGESLPTGVTKALLFTRFLQFNLGDAAKYTGNTIEKQVTVTASALKLTQAEIEKSVLASGADIPLVTKLKFDQSSVVLHIGKSMRLKLNIQPKNAFNKTLSWRSSDIKTATVDKNGKVTAKKVGKVTITVKSSNGKTAKCTVKTEIALKKLSLNYSKFTLDLKKSFRLRPSYSPIDATDKSIRWVSSNTKIATVDKNGKVTAKKAGKVTITAKGSNSRSAKCVVTVVNPAKKITLSKTKFTLHLTKSFTLKATVTPKNATIKSVTWTSSNPAVAAVNKNGKVTAKKVGTAVITASNYNGKKARCTITVVIPAKKVTLNKTKVCIKDGRSYQLKATITPKNASSQAITWKSSDTSIATVDKKGKVTARDWGVCTVTASTADGKKASCRVTVTGYQYGYGASWENGSGYVWPVPGYYELSSEWGEERDGYSHGAIDIAEEDIWGAKVVAAYGGTVVETYDSCWHDYGKDDSCGCGDDYGNYVKIDHGDGRETIYGHLSAVTVEEGDTVKKGELIGYVGSTGWSTGPHLHFECRYYDEKYDPMSEY